MMFGIQTGWCLYWLHGFPWEAQGPWGKIAMHRAGYVGDTMPGRTKKKLQPFTYVLFSQFEALEFQSSWIKRLNSWHFKVFHLNKLLKPFKWLFKKRKNICTPTKKKIYPFLGSFTLEIYLIEVLPFLFTLNQNQYCSQRSFLLEGCLDFMLTASHRLKGFFWKLCSLRLAYLPEETLRLWLSVHSPSPTFLRSWIEFV